MEIWRDIIGKSEWVLFCVKVVYPVKEYKDKSIQCIILLYLHKKSLHIYFYVQLWENC